MKVENTIARVCTRIVGAAVLVAGSVVAGGVDSARAATSPPPVAVYVTTKDLSKTLKRQTDVAWTRVKPAKGTVIEVKPDQTDQKLVAGFGVAMTDSSAYLLSKLTPAQRTGVLKKLYSTTSSGIGLSFLRIPIGGSDYVVEEEYTYDDQPAGETDPTLEDFSIEHDKAYILPAVREALKINPAMKVMANAWSQPAWMKTDGQLVTTTGPLGQIKPQFYGTYAQYLVKFLQAYSKAGVKVDYLGIQNEPYTPLLLVSGIPSTFIDPVSAANLVNNHLTPALKRARLSPTVVAGDDGYTASLANLPLFLPLAGKNVGAVAYHCYLGDAAVMNTIRKAFPGKIQLQTECSSKLSNVDPQQSMIRALRSGAQGYQLWNAVLDPQGGPKRGNGCRGLVPPYAGQDCIAPVTVDPKKRTVEYTSDFWALAQFSTFIKQGATRVESTNPSFCPTTPVSGYDCGVETVAFKNPDGSRALVVHSNDGKPHQLVVREGSKQLELTVAAGATTTFTWK